MSSEYALTKRKARKTYWCINEFAHNRIIRTGDEYYVYTDFKSSDLGYATTAGHPVQMVMCSACGDATAFRRSL